MPKGNKPLADHRKREKARAEKRKAFLKKTFTTGKLAGVVGHVVAMAESVFEGKGRGAEKKKYAVRLLNAAIDLPIINEAAEAWIFDHAIDAALAAIAKAKSKKGKKEDKGDKPPKE